jgi:hypothetical protein
MLTCIDVCGIVLRLDAVSYDTCTYQTLAQMYVHTHQTPKSWAALACVGGAGGYVQYSGLHMSHWRAFQGLLLLCGNGNRTWL